MNPYQRFRRNVEIPKQSGKHDLLLSHTVICYPEWKSRSPLLNLGPSKCIMKRNHTFEQNKGSIPKQMIICVALLETLHGVG